MEQYIGMEGDEGGLKSDCLRWQDNISYWPLIKSVDIHGNTVTYVYKQPGPFSNTGVTYDP